MSIKIKLLEIGKTQVDLREELISRYREIVSLPQLSNIINGRLDGPKAERVRIEIETIMKEWTTP